MEELNFITPKIEETVVEESIFKEYEAKREKIENMMHDYRVSLLSLGYDPEGKDLIEVITFLANRLNIVMYAMEHYNRKIKDNYIESLAGRIND